MTDAKDTVPLVELRDIWKAMRERLTQAARIVVLADPDPAEALMAALAGAGMNAEVVATVEEAAARNASDPPDLLLVAFDHSGDPRGALLGPWPREVDRIAVAWVTAPALAVEALKAGADDVLPFALPAERVVPRLRARVRQLVTLRLIDRFTVDLRSLAQSQRPGAVTVHALRDELKSHARWLEERGKRLLIAWSDDDASGRAAAHLDGLGASILTAESLDELVEVLHIAAVDVVVFHAAFEGGLVEGVRAVRARDPLVQVAILEPGGSADVVDEALASGAITAIPYPAIPWPGVASVIRRLLDAHQHAVHREKVVLELGRTFPEALDRWRVAREAALSEPGVAAVAASAVLPDADPSNRRIEPRRPITLPVVVRPTAPARAPFKGTVVNLALGGAFVACDRILEPRWLVECRISIAGTILAVSGVVVREEQAPALPNREGVRGFAVRFERLDRATADALRKLLTGAG